MIAWTVRGVVVDVVVVDRARIAQIAQLGAVRAIVDLGAVGDGTLAGDDWFQTAGIWAALEVGAAVVRKSVPDLMQRVVLVVLEELQDVRRVQVSPLASKVQE